MRRFSVLLLILCLLALVGCSGECLHLNMTEQTFAPTCDDEGYTLHRCEDCGYSFRAALVAPRGHSLTGMTTPPSCESEGFTEYVCACGYRYITSTVAPIGHSLLDVTHEPSCNTQGYTLHTCTRCSLSYTSDLVAPRGHSLLDVTHAPSCNAQGYTIHTCTRCSHSYTSDWVAPTGHDFAVEAINVTPALPAGCSVYTCRTCGYTYNDFMSYADAFDGAYAASDKPLAHGLDISYHNHGKDTEGNYLPLDFEVIREAGFDFVILRAGSTPRTENGQAKGGIDPVFEMNYAAAKAAGLDVGAYFYTYSTTVEDTRRDAELLLGWLDGKQLEYPVYFDIENGNISSALARDDITELCVTFLSVLQEHRYFGAIYTNLNWLVNHLDTATVTYLYDVWYARYSSGNGPYVWDTLSYGRTMGMWQYTQTGKIPAISETVKFDFDYAYKDYPTLIKKLGYNGYSMVE